MKTYALRCVEGCDDPRISWKPGTYQATTVSGNPTEDFSLARIYTDYDDVIKWKGLLEGLGCKFELLTFELVSVEE